MDNSANRQFASAASPLNWYEVAKLMHENAHILHNAPQGRVIYRSGIREVNKPITNRSVFLLAAFSMENLIKAFLVYENPHYIEGGKLSRNLLNSHGLAKLQEMCKKIPQPKRTKSILETLEAGTNSWARYPCSTSVEKQSSELLVSSLLWNEYNRVFDLYSKKLEQLLSKKHRGAYNQVGYVEFIKYD